MQFSACSCPPQASLEQGESSRMLQRDMLFKKTHKKKPKNKHQAINIFIYS